MGCRTLLLQRVAYFIGFHFRNDSPSYLNPLWRGVFLTLVIPRKRARATSACVLYQRRTFPLSAIINVSSFHLPSYYACYRTTSQGVIADPNVCEAGGVAKLGTLPEVTHPSKGAAWPWPCWKVSFQRLFPSDVKKVNLRSVSLTHFLVVPFLLQSPCFR